MRYIYFIFLFSPLFTSAQQSLVFPQKEINELSSCYGERPTAPAFSSSKGNGVSSGVTQLLKKFGSERLFSVPQPPPSVTGTDTLWVGITPNDTVTITGTYLQNGPIVVVNNGLLFIH